MSRRRRIREGVVSDSVGETPTPAGHVLALVRAAHRARNAARAGESVLLGVTALLVTLAAAAASGSPPGGLACWLAGGLGAVACGASWWREHRTSLAETARAADRNLRRDGALVTAFEVDSETHRATAGRSEIARLLLARVAERLRPADARRAVLPSPTLPIVAPILGAAVLALALEDSRRETLEQALGGVGTGMARAIERAKVEALEAAVDGGVDSEHAGELVDLELAVAKLQRKLDDGASEPEEVAAEARALDEELGALARKLDPTSAAFRRLDDARAWLDTARRGLEALAGEERREPGSAGAGEGGDGELAAGGRDGTMSGQSEAIEAPGSGSEAPPGPAPAPSSGGADAGLAAGRWWPGHRDALVERWVEARRAALAESDR